jgi:hypothetical protein
LRDRVRTAKDHYALQQGLDDRPAWRNVFSALRVLVRPAGTVLFYPERPVAPFAAYTLCTWLGCPIVKDPRRRFAVAFKRRNRTLFDPAELDAVPVPRERIINAGLVDISKSKVGRVFEEVFGYPLDLDPLRHTGRIVEKSDANATHDGRILEGPLAPDQIRPGSVYQKLINNQSDRAGQYVDYRLPVYGDEIPLVYLKYRDVADRFNNYTDAAVMAVEQAFSPEQVEKIFLFCSKMGADFCELDVLKDADDGRIYIVDVNSTPGAAVRLLPKGDRRKALDRMAASLNRLLAKHASV